MVAEFEVAFLRQRVYDKYTLLSTRLESFEQLTYKINAAAKKADLSWDKTHIWNLDYVSTFMRKYSPVFQRLEYLQEVLAYTTSRYWQLDDDDMKVIFEKVIVEDLDGVIEMFEEEYAMA